MSKSVALDKIILRQTWALESMCIHIEGLEGSLKSLKKNLANGHQSTWSVNHDILRWARSAHTKCYELHVLMELRTLIQKELLEENVEKDKQNNARKKKKVKRKKL